jgi:hypothetical protein
MVARPEGEQAGGERGILFREILKISVLMVKTNPNHVKRIGGEAHFAIGSGKSDILNFTRFLTEPLRNFVYAPGEPTNFSTLPNSTESRQFSQVVGTDLQCVQVFTAAMLRRPFRYNGLANG